MKNIIGRPFLLTLTQCYVALGVVIQKVNTSLQKSLKNTPVITPDTIQGSYDCAKFLNVSRRTVTRFAQEGLIPFSYFGSNKIFSKTDLLKAVELIPLLKYRQNSKTPKQQVTYKLLNCANSIAFFRIIFCERRFFLFTPLDTCLTEETTEALIKSCTLLYHQSYPFKSIPYANS